MAALHPGPMAMAAVRALRHGRRCSQAQTTPFRFPNNVNSAPASAAAPAGSIGPPTDAWVVPCPACRMLPAPPPRAQASQPGTLLHVESAGSGTPPAYTQHLALGQPASSAGPLAARQERPVLARVPGICSLPAQLDRWLPARKGLSSPSFPGSRSPTPPAASDR